MAEGKFMNNAAIITAGGVGRRMAADRPKQFLSLAGEPILLRTIKTFIATGLFKTIIITSPASHIEQTRKILEESGLQNHCRVMAGGVTRQESVKVGLDALPKITDYVMVHDGVRPLISQQIITACLARARESGAAITAIPIQDTVKSAQNGFITNTVDRQNLWRAQTPQAAKVTLLRQAYRLAAEKNITVTDEAALLELTGCQVSIIEGSGNNIKITVKEDLKMAEALLAEKNHPFRIGHGYDAHRLVTGRKLIMGGVDIPHTKGLLGHSDADVVTHALCDALLGALGQGDIGQHFPDSDPQNKGINSLILLEEVIKMASSRHYRLNNADITVIAQQPKLAPFLPQIQKNLTKVCQVEQSAINIKATTSEEMGFTGRQEGIACHAVVMLI
jgi:2-C-methyl-D-erythritol 4-phosphate cytidylyltransferase/2-C-methyl-D-erythritol 2,4-cyclodiphosphate synthase